MKKAILTFGLFTLVMLLTSFTTPAKTLLINDSIFSAAVEPGGQQVPASKISLYLEPGGQQVPASRLELLELPTIGQQIPGDQGL